MGVRLLVADDHELVRRGIVSLMADSEIEVVAAPGREDQPRPGFEGSVSCDVEWLS